MTLNHLPGDEMEELTRYKYTLRKPSSAKSDSSSSKTPHDLNMVSNLVNDMQGDNDFEGIITILLRSD